MVLSCHLRTDGGELVGQETQNYNPNPEARIENAVPRARMARLLAQGTAELGWKIGCRDKRLTPLGSDALQSCLLK